MTFIEFVKYVEENWEHNPNKVEAELEKFRYAISRDLRKEKNDKWYAALEALQTNIEDRGFWMQVEILHDIKLPD